MKKRRCEYVYTCISTCTHVILLYLIVLLLLLLIIMLCGNALACLQSELNALVMAHEVKVRQMKEQAALTESDLKVVGVNVLNWQW